MPLIAVELLLPCCQLSLQRPRLPSPPPASLQAEAFKSSSSPWALLLVARHTSLLSCYKTIHTSSPRQEGVGASLHKASSRHSFPAKSGQPTHTDKRKGKARQPPAVTLFSLPRQASFTTQSLQQVTAHACQPSLSFSQDTSFLTPHKINAARHVSFLGHKS